MPKKKPRKPRAKTYGALKRELDRVFSIWVRQRDADENGIGTCCTCGLRAPWPKLQAGHFVPRQHLSTRWLQMNVWSQCPQCNIFKKGAYVEYADFLIGKFGPSVIRQLMEVKQQRLKLTRADLSALIDRYSGFKHLPNEDTERYVGIQGDQP